MQKFRYLFIVFLVFLSVLVYAENKSVVKNTDRSKTILFMPFQDYSDSGMKFLSRYIPEKFKDNFSKNDKRVLLDYRDVEQKNIKLDYLYGKSTADDIFSAMKATKSQLAVAGRYIIHGKNISINWSVYELNGLKVTPGQDFTNTVDDNILDTISEYAAHSSDWIRINILKESIGKDLSFSGKGYLKNIFSKIEKSMVGFVFQNKYIRFIIILLFFLIISKFLVYLIEKVFLRLASRTSTDLDQQLLQYSKKPLFYIVLLFGLKISVYSLDTTSWMALIIDKVITACLIFFAAGLVAKSFSLLIDSWGRRVAERLDSRIDDDLIPLFNRVVRIVIYAIAVIMILSRFNINIAPLIASLGIAGFAIGFAVKDTLSNIIGGIILILDNSFVVGDKVKIDDDMGVIKEVGLRNTKLQTYDNEVIVIPNGELMNKKFKNYVLPDPKIRVVVNFGVAYGSDVDKVAEVVIAALKTIENTCDDPEPAVDFTEMADFSLNFVAKFWIPGYGDQYSKKIESTKLIYKTLNENNIEIPFPTHTVFLEK